MSSILPYIAASIKKIPNKIQSLLKFEFELGGEGGGGGGCFVVF